VKSANRKIEATKNQLHIIPDMISNLDMSILSPVIRFMYCTPDTVQREIYGKVVAKWCFSKESTERLQKTLYKVVRPDHQFAVDELVKFFSSGSGKKIKRVATELGSVAPDIERVRTLSKLHGVDEYEVMYIASLYKRNNKTMSKESRIEMNKRY
jgi:hypothetical protein